MGDRGVSLTEVIVVVLVTCILLAGTVFSYQDWVCNYKVEKATKELYSDLMAARAMAMQKNLEHFAVLNEGSYSILEDTDNSGTVTAGDVRLATFPKPVEYALNMNGSGNKVFFNSRGLVSPNRTVWFTSSAAPDYDCMTISSTRIILGRYVNGDCNKK